MHCLKHYLICLLLKKRLYWSEKYSLTSHLSLSTYLSISLNLATQTSISTHTHLQPKLLSYKKKFLQIIHKNIQWIYFTCFTL